MEAVRVRCCHAGLHPANISLDRACQNPCSTLVMTAGVSLPIHLSVPSRHSCRIFQVNSIAGRYCGRGVSVECGTSTRCKRSVLFHRASLLLQFRRSTRFCACGCVLQVTAAHTLLAGKSYVKRIPKPNMPSGFI